MSGNLALIDAGENQSAASLIGCALLAVNMDSNKKSYLDFFVPLIIESLVAYKDDYITLEILNDTLNDKFGINLPHHVIKLLLNKLKKENFVSYDSHSRCFKPNREKLKVSNFKDKQLRVLEKHKELLENFQQFLVTYYEVDVSSDEAEAMFEGFLNHNDSIPKDQTNSNYLLSCFIKKVEEEEPTLYAHYESIMVGNIFATAMYFTEPDRIQQKFKNTTLYFDTTFLIYALGYSGEVRSQPCIQLIEMLRQNGAVLRCFEHNIDEIESILRGCATRLETGQTDNFGTTEYFIQRRYLPSDIYRLIYGLREEIYQKLKIKVVERPSYDNQLFVMDERELSNYLSSNIKYKPVPLERDVESISAIYRLRKGVKSKSIEKCRAIFVTTNEGLSYHTRKYFQNKHNLGDNAPIVITDYSLTTIMWIKNPNLNPTLPRKRIIADCYASQQPPEFLVKKYLEKIAELKEKGEITDQDYYLLRVNPEARKILMQETQGKEEALIAVKIQEIAELTRLKLVEDKELELEVQRLEMQEKDRIIQTVKQEAEDKQRLFQNKIARQKNRSNFIAKIILAFLSLFISGIFCLGQYITLNLTGINIPRIFSIGLNIVFCLSFPLLSFWGIGFLNPLLKLHKKLSNSIYNKLYI
ncbi:hypothetical protein [Cytobacillus kochii]|uniref:hypothetical protein n=1 Tax=Cytobacillus kochii TaxID=859143 RepID=UPI00402A73E5